jgi:hypothetical protein
MDPSLTKVCSNCKEVKNLGEFYSCKTSIDKKQGVCIKCWRDRVKKNLQAHDLAAKGLAPKAPYMLAKEEKERNLIAGLKKCNRCGVLHPLDFFYLDKRNSDGKLGYVRNVGTRR